MAYKRKTRVNDDKLYFGLLRSHTTRDLRILRETAERRVEGVVKTRAPTGSWLLKLAWINAEIARRIPNGNQ